MLIELDHPPEGGAFHLIDADEAEFADRRGEIVYAWRRRSRGHLAVTYHWAIPVGVVAQEILTIRNCRPVGDGGFPLRVDALDEVLRKTTYKAEDIRLWKSLRPPSKEE